MLPPLHWWAHRDIVIPWSSCGVRLRVGRVALLAIVHRRRGSLLGHGWRVRRWAVVERVVLLGWNAWNAWGVLIESDAIEVGLDLHWAHGRQRATSRTAGSSYEAEGREGLGG